MISLKHEIVGQRICVCGSVTERNESLRFNNWSSISAIRCLICSFFTRVAGNHKRAGNSGAPFHVVLHIHLTD